MSTPQSWNGGNICVYLTSFHECRKYCHIALEDNRSPQRDEDFPKAVSTEPRGQISLTVRG